MQQDTAPNLAPIHSSLLPSQSLNRVTYGHCFESINYKGNNLLRVLGIPIFSRLYMFLCLKKCKL